MADHGPHFDQFPEQSGSPHGGAEYDAGFGLQALIEPHGDHFDKFSKTGSVTKHGPRWDDFGWKDMPVLHGNRFDEGFDNRTALANDAGHGTWFDAFSGGAQMRYLSEGAEYEATVINLAADHAVVERRDGQREEVEIGQILQWREGVATDLGKPATATRTDPKPGMPSDAARGGAIASLNTDSIPRSSAEAPSAHSATAAGGDRTDADVTTEPIFMAVKIIGDVYDVGKLQVTGKQMASAVEQHRTNMAHISNGEPQKAKCPGCGDQHSYTVGHTPQRGPKMGTSKMNGSCTECKFRHTFPAPKIKRQAAPSRLAKTADDELDVEKKVGAPCPYPGCGGKLKAKPGGYQAGGPHMCGTCKRDPSSVKKIDVAKDVDSTETAVQGATGDGKAWCGTCQHYCRKVEDNKCPTCGAKVTVKKFVDRLPDVVKRLRERAGA